MAKIARNFI